MSRQTNNTMKYHRNSFSTPDSFKRSTISHSPLLKSIIAHFLPHIWKIFLDFFWSPLFTCKKEGSLRLLCQLIFIKSHSHCTAKAYARRGSGDWPSPLFLEKYPCRVPKVRAFPFLGPRCRKFPDFLCANYLATRVLNTCVTPLFADFVDIFGWECANLCQFDVFLLGQNFISIPIQVTKVER